VSGAALRVVPFKCMWKEVQDCAGMLQISATACIVTVASYNYFVSASCQARIIIRPSTLVRSHWADEGSHCPVIVILLLLLVFQFVLRNSCVSDFVSPRIQVSRDASIQGGAHDDSNSQGCRKKRHGWRKCCGRPPRLGALRSRHPPSLQLPQQRHRDQASFRCGTHQLTSHR
jgi:hypothetical protein